MCQVTISNVDDHIVQGLKQIAWQRGLPFDESLRRLLNDTVEKSPMLRSKVHCHTVGIPARIPVATD